MALPRLRGDLLSARYRVPAGDHRVEQEIDRSRFITLLAPAPTLDEARAQIDRARAEFPDASHHCWAYVVGPPGSTACIGLSDDGEPHGTAGRPMLNALLHSEIGDVCAVVVRYFGGTLLGKGGLVRAYTGGVVEALATLPTRVKVRRARVLVEVEYGRFEALRRALPALEASVLEERWDATVGLRVELPAENAPRLERAVLDLTAGDCLFELVDVDP
ncbi:MAG: YigZ family protein [Polyangiales bacterium]